MLDLPRNDRYGVYSLNLSDANGQDIVDVLFIDFIYCKYSLYLKYIVFLY